MKRKNWIVTPIILGLAIGIAACLVTRVPSVSAMTSSNEKSDEAMSAETETVDVIDVDICEPTIDISEPETQEDLATEVEIEVLDKPITIVTEPEVEVTDPVVEKPAGCNHFWRREYEPETETEAGCIFESCLYCGEWHIVETIPPIGG